MPKSNLTEIAINVPSGVLWSFFFIVFIGIAMFSWILVHHWNYYGIKGNNKVFAKSLYFVGLGTFFVVLVLMIGSYDFL